jgi:hypothetical protein
MPWALFETAYTFAHEAGIMFFNLRSTARMSQNHFLATMKSENLWRDQKANLAGLLVFGRTASASEPRDHVFALLGLSRVEKEVAIDYEKPVLQVFEDATRLGLLEGSPNLHLMSYAGFCGDRDIAWPSWVPDLQAPLLAMPLASLDPANATKGSEYRVVFDGKRMKLRGFELDTVSVVGSCAPSCPNKPINQMWLDFQRLIVCGEWVDICEGYSNKLYDLTGEPTIDVFLKTIMGEIGYSYDELKEVL